MFYIHNGKELESEGEMIATPLAELHQDDQHQASVTQKGTTKEGSMAACTVIATLQFYASPLFNNCRVAREDDRNRQTDVNEGNLETYAWGKEARGIWLMQMA